MNKLTEVSVKNSYRATYNHYRKLIYPLSWILLIFLLTSSVQAKYSGGTGEPNNPYQIANANDMNKIGAHSEDWGSHFLLVNDINLAGYTGTQFNIIGNDSTSFTGVFDGNNHTIYNFTYESADNDYTGLFGYIDNNSAEVKNLGLINPDVNAGTGDFVGSLVGKFYAGTVFNCYVRGGSVSGNRRVGGLVGYNGEGRGPGFMTYVTISNCYATTAVSGSQEVGGLVGHNEGRIPGAFGGSIARISNCYAVGTVSGVGIPGNLVGGLVGMNGECGELMNCYAAGIVNGDGGGLVGGNLGGSFDKCFWDNSVNPSLTGTGGPTDPNVIGKPTTEMQKENTFTDVGWDFVEIWNIGENQTYPFLRVYPAGDLNHDRRVNFMDFAIFADHWLAGVE